MAVDFLLDTVTTRTHITDGYAEHAAYQSMAVYLADWERAYALLGRRIEDLRGLHTDRLAEVASGEWPRPRPAVEPSPAEGKVVSLMSALEESVTAAKAARDRKQAGHIAGRVRPEEPEQ